MKNKDNKNPHINFHRKEGTRGLKFGTQTKGRGQKKIEHFCKISSVFLDQHFLGPKFFWTKNFLDLKFFWTKTFVGPKVFLDQKIFWTKKFWVQKILGPKKFWVKKKFGYKTFRSQNFGSKKQLLFWLYEAFILNLVWVKIVIRLEVPYISSHLLKNVLCSAFTNLC